MQAAQIDGSEDVIKPRRDEMKSAKNLYFPPCNPSVSPDGKRIAFQSDRSGTMEIWVSGLVLIGRPREQPLGRRLQFFWTGQVQLPDILVALNGANPRPITDMKAPNTGSPSWSPDGKMIVFDSQKSGNLEIWVVSAEGGPARQLTDDPAEDGAARWSRDGRWIYFYSNRGGSSNIWKIPWGGGTAQPVTTAIVGPSGLISLTPASIS